MGDLELATSKGMAEVAKAYKGEAAQTYKNKLIRRVLQEEKVEKQQQGHENSDSSESLNEQKQQIEKNFSLTSLKRSLVTNKDIQKSLATIDRLSQSIDRVLLDKGCKPSALTHQNYSP